MAADDQYGNLSSEPSRLLVGPLQPGNQRYSKWESYTCFTGIKLMGPKIRDKIAVAIKPDMSDIVGGLQVGVLLEVNPHLLMVWQHLKDENRKFNDDTKI